MVCVDVLELYQILKLWVHIARYNFSWGVYQRDKPKASWKVEVGIWRQENKDIGAGSFPFSVNFQP